jgi:para-nitrobenzyl esterase
MQKIVLFFSFCFLLGTTLLAQIQTGENVAIANTESGKVRGYIQRGIFTYKGIPYAEAKRFEMPQKPKPWTNVRSSMTYGPVAPLIDPTYVTGDESEFIFHHDWGFTGEDCLRINIWSPNISDGKKRPVMFWIHGGGFWAGSSQELPSYDGENLARKGDVVVVSINHRLNLLGYLDLSAYGEKYKNSANLSIIDMQAALEWVKTNIANFGGDPGNVTIFGQSGGGAKVNTLMAMPSAKGLFHKAINQSGSFRTAMLEKTETQAIAAELLKILNIPASKVDSLQTIPFPILSEASKKALRAVENNMKAAGKPMVGGSLGWGPSRDGETLPYQLFSAEAMNLSKDIPLMLGTVKNEFAPFMAAMRGKQSPEQELETAKKQYGDKSEAYLAAVKKAYPNDKRPGDLLDIDLMFRPGCVTQSNLKSAIPGGAAVYAYMFTWHSPVMDGKWKSFHCLELPFVFNNVARCPEMTGATKEAEALGARMSQAWINFARSGNPNHPGIPVWEKYSPAKGTTMFFDNTCQIRNKHDADLMSVTGN